MSAGRLLKIEE